MMASEGMMNPVTDQRSNEEAATEEEEVSDFVMNRHCSTIALSTLVRATWPIMYGHRNGRWQELYSKLRRAHRLLCFVSTKLKILNLVVDLHQLLLGICLLLI